MTEHAPRVMLRDLPTVLGADASTVRRWRAQRKIPPPDVVLSQRSVWWYVETLQRAGFKLTEGAK